MYMSSTSKYSTSERDSVLLATKLSPMIVKMAQDKEKDVRSFGNFLKFSTGSEPFQFILQAKDVKLWALEARRNLVLVLLDCWVEKCAENATVEVTFQGVWPRPYPQKKDSHNVSRHFSSTRFSWQLFHIPTSRTWRSGWRRWSTCPKLPSNQFWNRQKFNVLPPLHRIYSATTIGVQSKCLTWSLIFTLCP